MSEDLFSRLRALHNPESDSERELRIAAEERERANFRANQILYAREQRLETARMAVRDEVYEKALSGSLDASEAVTKARAWWSARRVPLLVLSGLVGSGKTVAALDLVAEQGGYWLHHEDAVRAFAGMFGDSFDRQEEAKNARLLVLDDVGLEKDCERMESLLLELFNARSSASVRPWVITTNLKPGEWKTRYPNERLSSRMRELSHWVLLASGDMRSRS